MLKSNQKNIKHAILVQRLQSHCPAGSEALLESWLRESRVDIRISRNRVSKLGDYRPAQNAYPPRISINQGLSSLEFLITLAHELAHYKTLNKTVKNKTVRLKTVRHKTVRFKRVRPHGIEWKMAFRGYISEIISSGIIGQEISDVLIKCYLKRERIASSSCVELKVLLNPEEEKMVVRVRDIEEGEMFELRGGRQFIRGPKLRVRYRCRELRSGRIYTIHSSAEIVKKAL